MTAGLLSKPIKISLDWNVGIHLVCPCDDLPQYSPYSLLLKLKMTVRFYSQYSLLNSFW
jgi:hypothetical protein